MNSFEYIQLLKDHILDESDFLSARQNFMPQIACNTTESGRWRCHGFKKIWQLRVMISLSKYKQKRICKKNHVALHYDYFLTCVKHPIQLIAINTNTHQKTITATRSGCEIEWTMGGFATTPIKFIIQIYLRNNTSIYKLNPNKATLLILRQSPGEHWQLSCLTNKKKNLNLVYFKNEALH